MDLNTDLQKEKKEIEKRYINNYNALGHFEDIYETLERVYISYDYTSFAWKLEDEKKYKDALKTIRERLQARLKYLEDEYKQVLKDILNEME